MHSSAETCAGERRNAEPCGGGASEHAHRVCKPANRHMRASARMRPSMRAPTCAPTHAPSRARALLAVRAESGPEEELLARVQHEGGARVERLVRELRAETDARDKYVRSGDDNGGWCGSVSYTHLRAHETDSYL
eukprot:6180879-Pleurochrysis_carterae.AAC.1